MVKKFVNKQEIRKNLLRILTTLPSPIHQVTTRALSAWLIAFACLASCLAQDPAGEEPGIQFVNMEVPAVLRHYEGWTGKRIIMDGAVQSATITILTNEPMADEEKAIFVEKSLLLNGFALIPAGGNLVKAVVVPGVGGQPRSEGLEVFADPKDLPETDRIVAYVMRFDHLGAEAAAAALTSIFPSHGYGTIVPFAQASSVVITDSSATIRRYLELKPHIDVPRDDVPLSIREFSLERGDATKVVEALNELLSLQSASSGQGSTPPAGGSPAPASGGGAGVGVSTYAQVAPSGQNAAQTLLQTQSPDKPRVTPKIRADTRTNKVLAVAEPKDMDYIETLIGFLDSPAPQRSFYSRKLNYLRVATLLDNLPNVLQPGLEGGNSNSGTVAGGKTATGTNNNSSSSLQRNQTGDSMSQNGMYSGSSSMSSSRRGSSINGFDFSDNPGPQSIVIDKTFVMADNVQNRILATGPEEHLQLIDALIEELDQKPKQIQISAVIAQITLKDSSHSGFDIIRNVDASSSNLLGGALRFTNPDPSLSPSPILSLADTGLMGAVKAVPIAQGLTVYGKLSDQLNAYLSALESNDRVKVLARPTIYTQNDRKAVIKTGERIAIPTSTYTPYTTGTTGLASSISYEDVVLQIEVLPLINSDDQITLSIIQVNDDQGDLMDVGNSIKVPSIITQELATTVVVPNGGTVLLGGLISEDDSKTRSGIPRFVALPLVGPLFGNTGRKEKRQELLVFIQPRIINDAVDLAEAQGDVQARARFSPEVMEFASPTIRAESQPVRQPLLNRLFTKKPRPSQPTPTTSPLEPAPIVNPRSGPATNHR